tara:strand:- start:456 stop:791 length:336 start_codon:yes stop_codon:yes gene_type:complete
MGGFDMNMATFEEYFTYEFHRDKVKFTDELKGGSLQKRVCLTFPCGYFSDRSYSFNHCASITDYLEHIRFIEAVLANLFEEIIVEYSSHKKMDIYSRYVNDWNKMNSEIPF